jgi:hypothetical protein
MASVVNKFSHTYAKKRKRPGIHSKNNTSNSKKSKNYKKKYRGQGK